MNPLVIVFPVGQRDCMLATMLMRYLRDLRMPPTHECLIVYRSCDASWVRQIRVLVGTVFGGVVEIETQETLACESWPHAPNLLHKTAAKWMNANRRENPWFWFEPDCTPLIGSWVEVLEDEHQFNATPFTGHIQKPGPKDTYNAHVAGCRISPGNFFGKFGFIYDKLERAFDLEAADKIIPKTTQTNRMLHQYFIDTDEDIVLEQGPVGGYNKIIPAGYVLPVFKSVEDVDRMISSGYVIQHRCKDGSLIKWAREYHNLGA